MAVDMEERENKLEEYPMDDNSTNERRIFNQIICPDDLYTPQGVYWADLPWTERVGFVWRVDRAIALQDLNVIGSMLKKSPLSMVSWYFRNTVIPGAGLGLEGYVLFSIGNLQPLFAQVWPQCWNTYEVCNKNWVASITYLEVIGFILGDLSVGILGDWIGRRWGLIQDALIMCIGLLMLAASWGSSLEGWVICYAWFLWFFGIGIGGEHPVTITSSLEGAATAGKVSTREDRLHRGRLVTLSFLVQGWGQLVNQVLLIVLLVIFNKGSTEAPYSTSAAQYTFRLSFIFPAIGTLLLACYRTWKMPHASKQLTTVKRQYNVVGYDIKALSYCYTYYGGRLIATAGAWFCSDVFFYGNKLFQGQFIEVISNDPNSLMTNWTWNLVNITVSLFGYYFAAFLMDNKLYGRRLMQQVGFFVCFIMFIIPAFNYSYYTSPDGIHYFQAMYFISSFFVQFGSNCVTFLVAGEVYPTAVRATAHGVSAATGKLGALFASVLFNYIDTRTKFHVIPWFGLIGLLLTTVFLPDTTSLDLKEQERRWNYIRRDKTYHGVAIHPTHLSLWERMRGQAKPYDPELDWKDKIADIRARWEKVQAGRCEETDRSGSDGHSMPDEDEFPQEIDDYFQRSGVADTRQRGIMCEMDGSRGLDSK